MRGAAAGAAGLPRQGARRLMAIAAGVATLAAACSAGGPAISAGPLGEGHDRQGGDLICVPFSPTGDYTYGMDVVSNPAHQDAVVTAVELLDPVGVDLAEAVVSDVNGFAAGITASWPGEVLNPAHSPTVQAADGARIPAGSVLSSNVVAHLVAPVGQPGSMRGLRVRYTVGGAPYAVSLPTTLLIRERC